MQIDSLGARKLAAAIVEEAYAFERRLVDEMLDRVDVLIVLQESRTRRFANVVLKILEQLVFIVGILLFSPFMVGFILKVMGASATTSPNIFLVWCRPNVTDNDFVLFRAWSIIAQLFPKNEMC